MSGRKGGKKGKGAGIHMSKPEPPPFLQRMKEQMIANEDAERIERAERKRKDRPKGVGNEEDDPAVVKVNDDDLTEEEYKRMKLELETQYKLDGDDNQKKPSFEELDVDILIKSSKPPTNSMNSNNKITNSDGNKSKVAASGSKNESKSSTVPIKSSNKTLNYGSSDDEDDDD